MGDFNFNATVSGNTLNKVMQQYQMKCQLGPQEITTNDRTQIDVVFSIFDKITCGVYESYFSDHKPIFCMLNPFRVKQVQIKLDKIKLTPNQPQSVQPIKPQHLLKRPAQAQPQPKRQAQAQAQDQPQSEVIIVPSGEPIRPEELEAARAADIAERQREICRIIETNFSYLTDECVDKFIQVANHMNISATR